MDVYFIRHGETDHNQEHLHQPGTTALNERGREQAAKVGRLVKKCEATHLIASDLTRTAQTAKIVGQQIDCEPVMSELFRELKRPDYIIGRPHFGFDSFRYMWRWFFSKDEVYWKGVDGESRAAFLARIQRAKEYLETLPQDAKVLVVSHSIFINFFIAHICNEKPIPFFKAVLLFMKIKRLDNSSISHVTYGPGAPKGTCAWSLVKFDDDEHVES